MDSSCDDLYKTVKSAVNTHYGCLFKTKTIQDMKKCEKYLGDVQKANQVYKEKKCPSKSIFESKKKKTSVRIKRLN